MVENQKLTVLDLFKEFERKTLSKEQKKALKKQALRLEKIERKKKKESGLGTKAGILAYVKEAIAGNKLVASDFRINDEDFPLAANVVEFFTDRRFSTAFVPVAKQIEVGINYLTDYCPRCSDVTYAKCIPTKDKIKRIKRRIVFLEHGVCPKCGITRTQIWKKNLLPRYTEAALLVGQRGFKSSTTAILNAYLLHRLLKLQDPPQVYGLPSYATLGFTFTALTFVQAKNLIYREFYNFVKQSPWFEAYHQMLSQKEHELGEELYKFTDTLFHYKHRGLAGHVAAPDMKTARGYTRISATIDELGWFTFNKENAVKINAHETYISMKRSLLTIRASSRRLHKKGYYDIPTPMFTNISSPSNIRDKICQLVEQSKKADSEIFSRHYSTFEFNPYITPDDLKEEQEDDYQAYKRDYLAIPPMASNPFIPKRSIMKTCIDPEMPNLVNLVQVHEESVSGVSMLSADYELDKDNPYYHSPKILALDAGLVNNSFACALIAADENDDKEPIKIVTSLFEIIPHDGLTIDFSSVYNDLLLPIAKELNVIKVYADRWNSIKILQDFMNDTEDEIEAAQYSVSYNDFMTYKSELIKGQIIFPAMETTIKKGINLSSKSYPKSMIGKPITHFVIQSLGSNDILGKKIDKGDRLTDDLLRACVLGTTAADMGDNMERLLDSYNKSGKQVTRSSGVVTSVGASFITGRSGSANLSNISSKAAVGSYNKPYGY